MLGFVDSAVAPAIACNSAAMFGAGSSRESSRHFQVPGDDVVDDEELEDGGLSHRWYVSEHGGAKLLHPGSGLRKIILVFTGALLMVCSVATICVGLQRMVPWSGEFEVAMDIGQNIYFWVLCPQLPSPSATTSWTPSSVASQCCIFLFPPP